MKIGSVQDFSFRLEGLTRVVKIKGIPGSRPFLSNPCNAAWSITGPVKSVSPPSSRVMARTPNQSLH